MSGDGCSQIDFLSDVSLIVLSYLGFRRYWESVMEVGV